MIARKAGAIEAIAQVLKKYKDNTDVKNTAITALRNIKQKATNAPIVRKALESDSDLRPFISKVF